MVLNRVKLTLIGDFFENPKHGNIFNIYAMLRSDFFPGFADVVLDWSRVETLYLS